MFNVNLAHVSVIRKNPSKLAYDGIFHYFMQRYLVFKHTETVRKLKKLAELDSLLKIMNFST